MTRYELFTSSIFDTFCNQGSETVCSANLAASLLLLRPPPFVTASSSSSRPISALRVCISTAHAATAVLLMTIHSSTSIRADLSLPPRFAPPRSNYHDRVGTFAANKRISPELSFVHCYLDTVVECSSSSSGGSSKISSSNNNSSSSSRSSSSIIIIIINSSSSSRNYSNSSSIISMNRSVGSRCSVTSATCAFSTTMTPSPLL